MKLQFLGTNLLFTLVMLSYSTARVTTDASGFTQLLHRTEQASSSRLLANYQVETSNVSAVNWDTLHRMMADIEAYNLNTYGNATAGMRLKGIYFGDIVKTIVKDNPKANAPGSGLPGSDNPRSTNDSNAEACHHIQCHQVTEFGPARYFLDRDTIDNVNRIFAKYNKYLAGGSFGLIGYVLSNVACRLPDHTVAKTGCQAVISIAGGVIGVFVTDGVVASEYAWAGSISAQCSAKGYTGGTMYCNDPSTGKEYKVTIDIGSGTYSCPKAPFGEKGHCSSYNCGRDECVPM